MSYTVSATLVHVTVVIKCALCFSLHLEAKEIDSLAEKNKKIGELWRGLSVNEKEKYYTLAKKETTPGVGHCGDWKTVSKILSNMNVNVGFMSS